MLGYFRTVWNSGPDIPLFLAFNVFGCIAFGVTQVVFNLYLVELGYREDAIGVFSATQTVAMALTGLFVGALIIRVGVWQVTTAGFAIFCAASFAIAFAEGRPLLLLCSVLYGFGLCFLFNTTMPFIMEGSDGASRPQVAATAFSLISISVTIGSLVGGLLPNLAATIADIDAEGLSAYRATLVTGTALSAVGLLPLLRMRPSRRPPPMPAPTLVSEPASAAERRQIRADMGIFILAGGLMSLGVGMVMPFYNVFLTTLGADTRQIGYIFAAGGLCAAALGLAAPAVARRFGSLRAVFLLRCSIVPFYLLLILTPAYSLGILAHLVRQTAYSMSWPIDSSFIGELLPPRARASVFGLRGAAWNAGTSVAAFVGGWVIVRRGYDLTFVALIVFTALSSAVFVGYYRQHPLVRTGQIPSALPQRHPARRPPGVIPVTESESTPRTA
jgi:MFS family permease